MYSRDHKTKAVGANPPTLLPTKDGEDCSQARRHGGQGPTDSTVHQIIAITAKLTYFIYKIFFYISLKNRQGIDVTKTTWQIIPQLDSHIHKRTVNFRLFHIRCVQT